MTIGKMFRGITPFVKPYKWLVVGTLVMTFIGSLAAQVNAVVLDWTVDKINALIPLDEGQWGEAIKILTLISGILLGKEVLSAVITFAQRYYGERMRILVSRDMAQAVIEKMLTFRVAFFTADNNEPLTLQKDGSYQGQLNLTMTGVWDIHLHVKDAIGNTVAGGEELSELYWTIVI